jgi:hypothetical protein
MRLGQPCVQDIGVQVLAELGSPNPRGDDLMLFMLYFRDTFRRERGLSYLRALARRRSTNMARATRGSRSINWIEDGNLGDGPTSPSPSCGAAAELGPQAKTRITPSLLVVDMNQFPPSLGLGYDTLRSGSTVGLSWRRRVIHFLGRASCHLWILSFARASAWRRVADGRRRMRKG